MLFVFCCGWVWFDLVLVVKLFGFDEGLVVVEVEVEVEVGGVGEGEEGVDFLGIEEIIFDCESFVEVDDEDFLEVGGWKGWGVDGLFVSYVWWVVWFIGYWFVEVVVEGCCWVCVGVVEGVVEEENGYIGIDGLNN